MNDNRQISFKSITIFECYTKVMSGRLEVGCQVGWRKAVYYLVEKKENPDTIF